MTSPLNNRVIIDADNAYVGGGGGYASPSASGTAPNASALGGVAAAGWQPALPAGITFGPTSLKISGVQVVTTQQTGLGASLAAYTYSGTYATDLSHIQSLHNKVMALETIMRAHGLGTT